MKQIYNSIYDAIGNTPLVRIPLLDIPIFAKLEYCNPGGSIKDRSALYMINIAAERGLLKSNGIIIEASSGNQGAAAAMIGNSKGYKTIITMSEKVSIEKQSIFKAYNAEIVLCKPSNDFNDKNHYYQVAKRISENNISSYFLNQYFNIDNADAHFYGIAPEINNQIGDKVTYIFVPMGSGGTANGIARYMKQHNNKVKVIGVDSENSFIATNGHPNPYYLDGMGIDYQSPLYEKDLLYDVVNVSDDNSHEALRILAREYGLLVGPASGGSIAAILKYKKNFKENDCIVTIFTDSGRSYLSKLYYQTKNEITFNPL
jgi:cystathionine beta-synthase